MNPRTDRAWSALQRASAAVKEAQRTGVGLDLAKRNHTLALQEWRRVAEEGVKA